jgi:hypothetical protein
VTYPNPPNQPGCVLILDATDRPPEGQSRPHADNSQETRTTASDGRSCQRCGAEIRGRRWNGFCSDRCRMATKRERDACRRRLLVSRLREVVSEVEAEWFPNGTTPSGE